MIRWPAAVVIALAGCASASVNVVVHAEPWLRHESELLQHYVSEYVRSSTPITVTIQLEPAVLDGEHASLVATYVVADASGRTIDKQTLRVERQRFDDAGRTIAERIAHVINGS